MPVNHGGTAIVTISAAAASERQKMTVCDGGMIKSEFHSGPFGSRTIGSAPRDHDTI